MAIKTALEPERPVAHRAIEIARTGLAGCPDGTAGRTMLLTNLGGALLGRYEHTKRRKDLDAALEAFRAGLAETDEKALGRALLLNNLGVALAARAHADSGPAQVTDLTEAVAAHRSAVRTAGIGAVSGSTGWYGLCALGWAQALRSFSVGWQQLLRNVGIDRNAQII